MRIILFDNLVITSAITPLHTTLSHEQKVKQHKITNRNNFKERKEYILNTRLDFHKFWIIKELF